MYTIDAASYNPADKAMAYVKAAEWGEKIPLGVIYKNEKPTYEEKTGLNAMDPLVEHPIEEISIQPLLSEFL